MTLVVSPGAGSVQAYMRDRWARPLLDRLARVAAVSELFTDDRARVAAELPYAGDLLFVGHGTSDALGQPALFDAGNVAQIGGMIAAVACRSAQGLGPEAVRGGVRRYVGFTDDLHVIDAAVLDRLVVEHLEPLMTARWTAEDFEERFKRECEAVQTVHFSGHRRGTRNAFLIASAAQVMKLTVRVL